MKDGIANRMGFFKFEEDKDADLQSAMVDKFKYFVRAGGTIPLDQWLALDQDTTVALAEAAEEVYAERAECFISNLIGMAATALSEAGEAHAKQDDIMRTLEEEADAELGNPDE
tara:strand:- start:88 stop:429 length:342 start_codon:yes stop_codon:yes gene_type:complete